MNEQEYKKFISEFCKRFPDTGNWLRALPDETLDYWFREFFSPFELRDATASLDAVMRDVETAFSKRERLPAILMKHMQEIRWNREQRIRSRQRDKAVSQRGEIEPIGKTLKGSERECFELLIDAQAKYRHEQCVTTTASDFRIRVCCRVVRRGTCQRPTNLANLAIPAFIAGIQAGCRLNAKDGVLWASAGATRVRRYETIGIRTDEAHSAAVLVGREITKQLLTLSMMCDVMNRETRLSESS